MQFSLRTLFIVVTLASMALAVVAWRQARERRLTKLVEDYLAAHDAQRYDDAHALARKAKKEFPKEIVVQTICEQSEMIQALARGEKVDFTFQCLDDSQVAGKPAVAWTVRDLIHYTGWRLGLFKLPPDIFFDWVAQQIKPESTILTDLESQ